MHGVEPPDSSPPFVLSPRRKRLNGCRPTAWPENSRRAWVARASQADVDLFRRLAAARWNHAEAELEDRSRFVDRDTIDTLAKRAEPLLRHGFA